MGRIPNEIVLRPPTSSEIKASGTNPSDYQIAQLRIMSKVLLDFGLVKKVYRSKKTVLQANNINRLEKHKSKFLKFFSLFKSNEDVSNIRSIFYLIEETDKNFIASDYTSIIRMMNNKDNKILLESFVTKFYMRNKNVNTLSAKDKRTISHITDDIDSILFIARQNNRSYSNVIESINLANYISGVLRDDEDMKKFANTFYAEEVESISLLLAKLNSFIEENKHNEIAVHSNTALHDEAGESLRKLDIELKRNGFHSMSVGNLFEYYKQFKPDTVEWISSQYGLAVEDMNSDTFKTWEDFARYFYAPDMIRKIEEEQVCAKNRSRAKDEQRKGRYQAIDQRSINKRKKRLVLKYQGNESMTQSEKVTKLQELEKTLALKEKDYNEAKDKRDKIKANMNEAKHMGNESLYTQLKSLYNEVNRLTQKIGKSVAAVRHNIKIVKSENVEEEISKKDIELIHELEQKEKQILNEAIEVGAVEGEGIREFEEKQSKFKLFNKVSFDPSEINYRTWSFVVNSINPKIIEHILDELNRVLPQATGGTKEGDKWVGGYFNVDAYEPEYSEIATRATEIIVDYPAESKLFKIFKKSPDTAYSFMNSIIGSVRNKFKTNTSFLNDSEYIKINEKF